MEISVSVTIAVFAGSGSVAFLFIKFWGKTFVEKRVAESLKEKQHELDAQLERLKSANDRVSHIMTSLYDEEKAAIKEMSGLITTATEKVYGFAYGEYKPNTPDKEHFGGLAGTAIIDANNSLNRHCIFLEEDIFNCSQKLLNKAVKLHHALMFHGDATLERNIEAPNIEMQNNPKYHADELLKEHHELIQSMRVYMSDIKRKYH